MICYQVLTVLFTENTQMCYNLNVVIWKSHCLLSILYKTIYKQYKHYKTPSYAKR